eukprot:g40998.t1
MKQSKIADKDTSLSDAVRAECQQRRDTCPDSSRHTCAHCHHCRHQIGLPESQPKESSRPEQCPWLNTQILCRPNGRVIHQHLQLSLLQAEVPTYFKETTIIPIPKEAHAMYLNEYRS